MKRCNRISNSPLKKERELGWGNSHKTCKKRKEIKNRMIYKVDLKENAYFSQHARAMK